MFKSNQALYLIPIVALGAALLISDTFFVLNENQQGVVTQFGKFVRSETTPGLKIKMPLLQDVVYYDNRLLDHDIQAADIVTKDKRTLVVDNFAKWRIVDPEKFYKRARTIRVAKDRLRDIIFSELRLDFGANDLVEIVSSERAKIMDRVTERSNMKAQELHMGVEIVDVRIMRADFPPENQKAVFERMRAERNRIARQFRAEGDEEAKKIIAETDKRKTILLAEAYKEEQKLRGEGDALATKISAAAFGRDPKFYEFVRSLDAYKNAVVEKKVLLISKESPFFKYLK